MADYDKDAVPVGYVHATVTLSGEAKLLAAELERLRVTAHALSRTQRLYVRASPSALS